MKSSIFPIIAFFVLAFEFAACCNDDTYTRIASFTEKSTKNRISAAATSAKEYLSKHEEYNSEVVFLIDMKMESGKDRFFVYDLNANKLVDKGLVAHGSGSETDEKGKLNFSNVKNSYCTSLGKYAIGISYNGQFGKGYKLYGLDSSNNNAFERVIVLHKYKAVPYEEQETPICNSLGCPMVNSIFFERLETILDNSDKQVLMYIYY